MKQIDNIIQGKPSPASLSIEKSFLASCIQYPDLVRNNPIKPDDIYSSQYQEIYSCLCEMAQQGKPINIITVSEYLIGKIDDPELAIVEIMQSNFTKNLQSHIETILDKSKRRKLIELSCKIAESAYSTDSLNVKDEIEQFSNILRIGNSFEDLVFVPDWNNEPELTESLITLNQTKVLSRGNISLLTAQAGKGKSNVCATIWSATTGFFGDMLGFSVPKLNILFIDTEMSNRDSWITRKRALLRAGINKGDPVPEKLYWHNIRAIPTIEQKTEYFFQEIDSGKYDLVILDGAGDLVSNVNDPEECNNLVSRLCAVVHKRNIGALVTLHTNPNDASNKARGHLGSELWRKAESNLIIESLDSETRRITTEFSLGKNRSGSDQLSQCFCWSDEQAMHISCGEPEETSKPQTTHKRNCVLNLMGNKSWTYSELTDLIITKMQVSERTAKRYIKELLIDKIQKNFDGTYIKIEVSA